MAMTATEVKQWLDTLRPDDLIAIDDGGLSLVIVDNPDIYCEVGGIPLDEDDEDQVS